MTEFTYPVYAILEGAIEGGQVYTALHRRVDGEVVLATALFTSIDKAARWQAQQRIAGQFKTFDSPVKLWNFVQAFRPPTYEVAFDPELTPEGINATSYSVMEFIERYLPTVRFFDYPVHVVRKGAGYSCLQISAEGHEDALMLPFFTDLDLAERYINTKEPQGNAVAIETPMEFIHLLSVMVGVQGVLEDPGDSGGNLATDRATMLRNLQTSLEE